MKEPMQRDLENKRMGRHEVTEIGEKLSKAKKDGKKRELQKKRD